MRAVEVAQDELDALRAAPEELAGRPVAENTENERVAELRARRRFQICTPHHTRSYGRFCSLRGITIKLKEILPYGFIVIIIFTILILLYIENELLIVTNTSIRMNSI